MPSRALSTPPVPAGSLSDFGPAPVAPPPARRRRTGRTPSLVRHGWLIDQGPAGWTATRCAIDASTIAPPGALVAGDTIYCATPAAGAHLLVSRYVDQTPVDSLAAVLAAAGVPLGRTHLARWLPSLAACLAPEAEAIREQALTAEVILCGNMLLPGHVRQRLWAYAAVPGGSTTPAAIWYRLTPDRSGAIAAKELAESTALPLAPAGDGYGPLIEGPEPRGAATWDRIQSLALDADPWSRDPLCRTARTLVDDLRRVERQARALSGDERQRARRTAATPLLLGLAAELDAAEGDSHRAPAVRRFAALLRGTWPALCAFLDDGRIPVELKAAFPAFAPAPAWWPAGLASVAAAPLPALATLVETCRLAGSDPRARIAAALTALSHSRTAEKPRLCCPEGSTAG